MAKIACLTGPFDRTNPSAQQWAKHHAGDLVQDISAESKRAINRVITRAFKEGIPPRPAARMIKSAVSLTERQADALVNLHQKIITSPGKVLKAGKTRIRI